MLRIHEAALDALEQVGLSQAPPTGVAAMVAAGAIQGDDGRLRFPRALVEDMLAKAARGITLYGRDPRHHLDLSGTRVHYGTAGAAVNLVDAVTGDYRPSTARDLHDSARLAHHLDNLHFFQRTMVCLRRGEPRRDGHEHALRLPCGHDEACRHLLFRPPPASTRGWS